MSFQTLLNCLDGVGTQDGVIVVATANDPTCLDAAILKRPGRFDRVVHFRNPDPALRREYYQRLSPVLQGEYFEPAIPMTEGGCEAITLRVALLPLPGAPQKR